MKEIIEKSIKLHKDTANLLEQISLKFKLESELGTRIDAHRKVAKELEFNLLSKTYQNWLKKNSHEKPPESLKLKGSIK